MNLIAVRASSLPELFDCAARWESKQLRKMRMPSSANAALGKAVHAGTALFDGKNLEGTPISPDDAAGAVVDSIHRPDEDIEWGEDSPQEAEGIALALHEMYCRQIAPHKNYVAVESTCECLEITNIGIALTGTVDRVIKSDTGYSIADIKTGKNAVSADGTVKTQGHAAQIAVYELLAEKSFGVPIDGPAEIIGLQVAKTDKGRRVGTGIIANGRDLLLGFEENPGLLKHAAAIINSGMFPGNPRSMMCNQKYCPVFARCKWRR